jgi:hypothetical protein
MNTINELFDKSYKWKFSQKIGKQTKYVIMSDPEPVKVIIHDAKYTHEIVFQDQHGNTEASGVFGTSSSKIFGAVWEIMQSYMQSHKVTSWYFTADKDTGNGSRVNLYSVLANKIAQQLGWKLYSTDSGNVKAFVIDKDNVHENINHGNDIIESSKINNLEMQNPTILSNSDKFTTPSVLTQESLQFLLDETKDINELAINELFDSAYRWKQIGHGKDWTDYEFNTENDTILVNIMTAAYYGMNGVVTEVIFGSTKAGEDTSLELTGLSGNRSSKVFATVMDIMKDFQKTHEVKRWYFTAEKDVVDMKYRGITTKERVSNSRTKLYRLFAQKLAKQSGKYLKIIDKGDSEAYLISEEVLSEETLTELFDSSLDWTYEDRAPSRKIYRFTYKGEKISVLFDRLSEKTRWEFQFSVNNSMDKLGIFGSESIKIFSTIVDIARHFIKNNRVDEIRFSSVKDRQNDGDYSSGSRSKLYDSMARKLSARIGWSYDKVSGNVADFFVIRNKSIKEENLNEFLGTSGTFRVWHGSNKKFERFTDKTKRIANDFFGGGVAYTTDDKNIAINYARSMARNYGGSEILYELKVIFQKIFDVDEIFTGEKLKQFFNYIKVEAFARGASLLKLGTDTYKVLSDLKNGIIQLSGHDVFRGLSRGMNNSAAAEAILKKLGYDGLRYNGGANMSGSRHNVYIAYNPDSIQILNKFQINRRVPALAENLELPQIGHIPLERSYLPQIMDQKEFLNHLSKMDITWEKIEFDPNDLKATQMDFDMVKVYNIVPQVFRGKSEPILTSSDNHILDGHHRWLAHWNLKEPIMCYCIDCPILELIKIANDFYCEE